VSSGVGHVTELDLSRPSSDGLKSFHYIAKTRTVVRLRIFLAIPEADSNPRVAVGVYQLNYIAESFVGAN
jgi:hypothetical protein